MAVNGGLYSYGVENSGGAIQPPPGSMYTSEGVWAPSPQGGYYLYADNMGNVNPNPPVAPYTTPVGPGSSSSWAGSAPATQPGYGTPGGSTAPAAGNTYVNGVGTGYFESGPAPELGDRSTMTQAAPYQPSPYTAPTATPSTFGTPAYTPPPPIGAVPSSSSPYPASPVPGYSPTDYAAMSQNFSSMGTSPSGQQMVNDVNAQNAARNEADMAMWNAMNQYQNQQFGAPIPANPNLPEGMVAVSAGSSYPGTQQSSPVPAGMPVLYPGSSPTTGTMTPAQKEAISQQQLGQTSGGATNGGPVSYTPPAAVPYNNTQTGGAAPPVSFQPPQTFTDYYGQQPGGLAPSVPPGTTGTTGTSGSTAGGNTVAGGLPPIGQPTAPTFNLPSVQPYGQVPGYTGYSYDVGQAPGQPTITPWSPTVGSDGAFAGMPGGQAPSYNFAPLYGQDQIQGMVNRAMGQNAATEAAANRDAYEQMAGRGFSTDSSAIGAGENRTSLNRMLADTQAQAQIPIQAQQANAQYGLDLLRTAQGDRGLSQQAWQMATQLPLAYQQLGLQGYSAGQNALNNYYNQLNALGQLNNQNYQTALGGYNAGNQALNDYYQNVLGQGQLGLQGYNSYYDALGQYGQLANQRYGLGLTEQSNNISLFNSLLGGLLGTV